MNQIVRLDPTTLSRALIGFDQMFDQLERRFATQSSSNNYPPHNVIKHSDSDYEIQVAVSGFEKEEIVVEVDQDQLIIRGQRDKTDDDVEYLYRGLATRDFVKSLTLAEYMEVGEAKIKNGIISVRIKRVIPEALKPRQIKIIGE
jgi:molecular chaperone IbpA